MKYNAPPETSVISSIFFKTRPLPQTCLSDYIKIIVHHIYVLEYISQLDGVLFGKMYA